jgi:hypothetical protein
MQRQGVWLRSLRDRKRWVVRPHAVFRDHRLIAETPPAFAVRLRDQQSKFKKTSVPLTVSWQRPTNHDHSQQVPKCRIPNPGYDPDGRKELAVRLKTPWL